MRLLVLTTLFPNAARPDHGVFVEARLRALVARGGVEARVLAPVPWFASRHPRWGTWAEWARVPPRELRHGIEVRHPRYLHLPRVGMRAQPFLLAAAALRAATAWRREGFAFDAIDAHFLYPDGVAAWLVARRLGVPFAVTGRGTDLNLYPAMPWPRRWMSRAVRDADAPVTVCEALRPPLLALGADARRVRVLRNGVDLERFRPLARDELRARMGIAGPTLASVGHLVARKGHDIAIAALGALPGWTLLVAGDGPERGELERQAVAQGLGGRVRFLGRLALEDLARVYNAADILVLASDREGRANVLLESMACGTPVVATRIWGTPEVVSSPAAGLLVVRDARAIADGVRALAAAPPPRDATRRHAEAFSWDATAAGLEAMFRAVAPPRRGDAAG
ncbi:MAG: glycosyltransferase family 4 protein [Alphaproteobacteria bacterium]|nr:glycosyltransferase family 4 protein [Alphaproteobacteria bacterium]